MIRQIGVAVMAFMAVVIPAIGVAAPASSGCEAQVFAKYCDGPVRPDGTWDRCFEAYGTTNAFGAVLVPRVGRCYPVDPNNFPPTPLGQPQYHIYP